VGELKPDHGQDHPLQPVSGTAQEQVPGDEEDRVQSPIDVKPPPSSPPVMAMGTGQLVPESIQDNQANKVSTEERCVGS